MKRDYLQAAETAELYISGQLDEQQQVAFEDHFLECPECFEAVALLQTVATELGRQPKARRSPYARWGAIAAMLAIGGMLTWWRLDRPSVERAMTSRPTAAAKPPQARIPEESPMLLARIDPPSYTRPILRGGGEEAFLDAMRQYNARDYSAAIPKLQSAVREDPSNSAAQFFLGICYLMQGDDSEGRAHLSAVVAMGDSPELESAHFYLAEAWLRQGRKTETKAELRRALALQGGLQSKEKDLLRQVEGATARR
jgi:tetratricopeptide (TPR) repeat protein